MAECPQKYRILLEKTHIFLDQKKLNNNTGIDRYKLVIYKNQITSHYYHQQQQQRYLTLIRYLKVAMIRVQVQGQANDIQRNFLLGNFSM